MASSTNAKKIITVIGATGGTGKQVVKQALDAGHIVKALVRNAAKLDDLKGNTNLTVTVGDVTKVEDVKTALKDSTDCIVSLGGRDKICSTAQPAINEAINSVDSNMRQVVVTSMAVGDSYHDVSWGTRRFADWIISKAIIDKNLQERSIIRDTTNWVIVRPAGLSDGPLTGNAQSGPHACPASYKTISRADVADFMLKHCLSENDEWKRYPVTVYPPQ